MFIFLLVCSLLVPLSMIILGKRWENNPPEDINGLSGYRTTMSRLNKDTWSYAHKYWGKINFCIGVILAVISSAFVLYIQGRPDFETLIVATVYKGNIIKNLIMDCQSYTKYRPNETTGGIFVSWRRKEELPTGA